MFTDVFSQLLQEKNLKPYHLSKEISVSSGLVSDYVNGKKMPSLENIVKIADCLNVSVDFLLGRTSNPKVNEPDPDKENTPDALRSEIISAVSRLSDHQTELLQAFLKGLLSE